MTTKTRTTDVDRAHAHPEDGPPVPWAVYVVVASLIAIPIVAIMQTGAIGDWADVVVSGLLTTLLGWGILRGNYASLIVAGIVVTALALVTVADLLAGPERSGQPAHQWSVDLSASVLLLLAFAALLVVGYSRYFAWHNKHRYRMPPGGASLVMLACLVGVLWGIAGDGPGEPDSGTWQLHSSITGVR